MQLDDEVCLCFHVTKRKILNHLRVHRPRVPSQLTACGGSRDRLRVVRFVSEKVFRAGPTESGRGRRHRLGTRVRPRTGPLLASGQRSRSTRRNAASRRCRLGRRQNVRRRQSFSPEVIAMRTCWNWRSCAASTTATIVSLKARGSASTTRLVLLIAVHLGPQDVRPGPRRWPAEHRPPEMRFCASICTTIEL